MSTVLHFREILLVQDLSKCVRRPSFQGIRETDPKVCMKMLKLYEEIGKVLGPEEIGIKILPGVIPMLISG